MSKIATIDALTESAILQFSRFGYAGASLRDIAVQANVPLSTIHMYFGSKNSLYLAAQKQAWEEIDQDRVALLQAALDRVPHRPAPLADLIHALAEPIVRRALSKSEHEASRIVLIRMGVPDQPHHGNQAESAARAIIRWIDGMTLTCPTLSRQDVVWAYSFVIGTIYSWQIVDHRYDMLLGADSERSVEEVLDDIVAFGVAGVEAIVARREAARGRLAEDRDYGQASI